MRQIMLFRWARVSTNKPSHLGVDVLDEIEIIRLNVERYRRMLQIEVDETARQAIQKILMEFEAKLVSHKRRAVDSSQC